jgi:hypothetical protein
MLQEQRDAHEWVQEVPDQRSLEELLTVAT